jgi:methyl-accepting chemotaxis protein
MKPLDSQQDRAITVKTFINARFNKIARITNYSPMVTYLNGSHIQVLYKNLPKTGQKQVLRTTDYGTQYVPVPIYSAADAEMYLEWLISVVQGFEPASEEIINKAYDQLGRLILILTDVTEWKEDAMLSKPYDWVTRMEKFEEQVNDDLREEMRNFNDTLEFMHRDVEGYTKQLEKISEKLEEKTDALNEASEKQMSDVAKMLAEILTWMKKYAPTLDALEEEYKGLINTRRTKKK